MVRYAAIAFGVLVALGLAGYATYGRSFDAAPAPPVVAASGPVVHARVIEPAAATAPALELVEVEGRVEKRAGDRWVALADHDPLTAQDTIRTGDGARARIQTGDTIVELGSRSEITVGEISATLSHYLLNTGRVSAKLGAAGRTIRIETRSVGAIAEAASGRFDVLDAAGRVAVAAEDGRVQVRAHGTAVDVRAGELTTVTAGAAPTAPAEVPPSLFLKIAPPDARGHTAALRGTTEPGAVVTIGATRVAADDRGAFSSQVPLKSGENVIVVLVEDAMGRREQQIVKQVVDDTGPKVNAQVHWK
ncbi:MAG TPA: FecR domain-containing protein [Kofleriaceae bacterium]|jgi:hypothetical protein